MILQLINSKGRIVYTAKKSELDNSIDINHESGGGVAYKPEDLYLTAACCLNDNPSCKITGSHTNQFKEYCKGLTWLQVKF